MENTIRCTRVNVGGKSLWNCHQYRGITTGKGLVHSRVTGLYIRQGFDADKGWVQPELLDAHIGEDNISLRFSTDLKCETARNAGGGSSRMVCSPRVSIPEEPKHRSRPY